MMVEVGNPIERQVLEALQDDQRTESEPIEVVDKQGVVTLKGSVSSTDARSTAEQITEAQEGVVEVINDLVVEGEEGSEDLPFTPSKRKTG